MSGDDADVLARAKQGDRSAFRQVVDDHHRRVYQTALRLMGNHADADDVAQEVFVKAYRAIPKFDGRSQLGTWLYRITVNTALNQLRKRARTGAIRAAVEEQTALRGVAGTDAEHGERLRRVLNGFQQLSPSLRITLALATLEALPYREIAQLLEIPEGTVAWRVNEARGKLAALVDGADSGDSEV